MCRSTILIPQVYRAPRGQSRINRRVTMVSDGRLALIFATSCLILMTLGADKRHYKTSRLEVPLDHFSFSSNKTFKLKYLINDTYWSKSDGPILFYTGNEGTIELFAEHTGLIWNLAPKLEALIVFAEHRYYGESLPFGNESLNPHNIGYLTTSQALADYADVIKYILSNNTDGKNPVFAIGGSYGGMLAAYFRMKYPHIVYGALAASAPIFQFEGLVPCDAFYRIVTSAYRIANRNCRDNIRKSWSILKTTVSTPEGRKFITNEFKLCKNLTDNKDDIKAFKDWLIDTYTNLAMVNYPYPNDFLAPLPEYPVRAMCESLKNASLTGNPLLSALSTAIGVFTNYTGQTKCNSLNEDYMNDLGVKAWDYQACTEMVMPMCSTGVDDMFENEPFDRNAFSSECKKKWSLEPSYKLPLVEYGGTDLKYHSNIIFSNGLMDPWASGGVFRNYSSSIITVIIPEGAHHLDLMDNNKNDPFSVQKAREFYFKVFSDWTLEYQENN